MAAVLALSPASAVVSMEFGPYRSGKLNQFIVGHYCGLVVVGASIWSEKEGDYLFSAAMKGNVRCIKKPCEPSTQKYCASKRQCAKLIDDLCQAYLNVLPSVMGCGLCQFVQTTANTSSYQHYCKRKAELAHVKELVSEEDFDPHDVIEYLEKTMAPFNGEYGKNFHEQCDMALKKLLKQWQ